MSAVKDARTALELAVRGVPGVIAFGVGQTARTPGVVVLPPVVHWKSFDSDPDSATFTVVLCVEANDNSVDTLLDLLPALKVALEQTPGAVDPDAAPLAYPDGGRELPAYALTVEYPL